MTLHRISLRIAILILMLSGSKHLELLSVVNGTARLLTPLDKCRGVAPILHVTCHSPFEDDDVTDWLTVEEV